MAKPTVVYFPVRALGESIRLTLAAAGVDFVNEAVNKDLLKQDLDTYSFGQCPRYYDADVDLVQSHAIVRYLGRKHGLYGSSDIEAARIDQLLDGMSDLKIYPLIYLDAMQTDEARDEYWRNHLEPEAARGSCKGAHMLYVQNFVQKHGKDGFAVGGKLSIADIILFNLVDMHKRVFGERFDQAYPALAAHHAKVAALPTVAAYLAGPNRPAK
ncbi:hypothetical protein ABPG77_006084 [Micractinium sp. CCAP 211/92]